MPKCEYTNSEGKKCNSVKSKHSKYCHHHEPKTLINPTPSIPTPFSENSNENLNFEIELLRKYLSQLVKDSPKKLDPSTLKIQFQLIEQIRKLVHSLSTINSQTKVYSTVTKIIQSIIGKVVDVVNKHVNDENIKEILANELMAIANSSDANEDLNKLLKTINPNKGFYNHEKWEDWG